jgi:hypothetical protein
MNCKCSKTGSATAAKGHSATHRSLHREFGDRLSALQIEFEVIGMKTPFAIPQKLADLVDMDSPDAVLDEVLFIMALIDPRMDPSQLSNAFSFMVSLYQGRWPAEQACNTHFHDLRHITDTTLAMARLIHGAFISGHRMNQRQIFTGLVAAMAHDAGYIQDKMDGIGTGAKFTTIHVRRSMDFIEKYGRRYGLNSEEIPACRLMIQCTDLDIQVDTIRFCSKTDELLGKILGCADLIGQMADRIYLEKLFYLYREFKEGQVRGYRDEMDLLAKTLAFFPLVADRIENQLDKLDQLAAVHFKSRWNIPLNLYDVAINRQKEYLEKILARPEQDPARFLRRKNIVHNIFARSPRQAP